MPTYLASWTLWRDLLPVPAFACLIALVLAVLFAPRRPYFHVAFAVVFSVTLLGLTAGLLTGQSREPAIGAIVPAVLTLIGAVSVYLFGTKDRPQQLMVAVAVIGFSFCLLVGTFWGARLRYDFEQFQVSEGYRLAGEAVEQNIRLQRLLYDKQIQDLREKFSIKTTTP